MPSAKDPPLDRPDEAEISIHDLWASLRRARWLLVGVTAATVAVVMLLTFLAPPTYESEAVLRIRSERDASDLMPDLGAFGALGLPGLGNDEIDTEMGILRSRRIATAVTDSLNLHLRLRSPDRPLARVLTPHSVDETAVPADYTLRRQAGGLYSVAADGAEGPVLGPERVSIGEEFSMGNMRLSLAPELRQDPPRTIEFTVLPAAQAAEETRERLKVDRQAIGSKLVEVKYRDRDPEIAAAVVNRAVQEYVAYRGRTESSESRHTIEVLRDQVGQYERQLTSAEERLRSFQERQRIVAPEEQATQQVRRVAEIQAQHDAVSVEREALADLLAQVRTRTDAGGGGAAYRQLATFPSFISNGAIQDVLQNLIELENERSELLGRRTEDNVDVRTITARIEDLENQLYRLGTNYLQSLETQRAAAARALSRFGQELEQIPAKEVEYARRVRDQRLLSEIYLMLQTRLKEAEVKEAIDADDVRIVDDAIVPDDPVFPKPLVNLVLATLLGLMLGVSVVVGRDILGTSIRSTADAESAAPGLPVLATIPAGSGDERPNGSRINIAWIGRIVPRQNGSRSKEALVTRLDPWSAASEAYRALAVALLAATDAENPVLVVTSPGAGDGKAEVAANLAVTLAQRGAKTLLVGADLRSTALTSLLATPVEPGLTNVLLEGLEMEATVRELGNGAAGGGDLQFLAPGSRPNHPGELLGSEQLSALLDRVRGRYSHIVVEAPAVGAGADAGVLGALSDATLLVVRDGVTERNDLRVSATVLRRAGVPVAGVALNASGTVLSDREIHQETGRAPRARV